MNLNHTNNTVLACQPLRFTGSAHVRTEIIYKAIIATLQKIQSKYRPIDFTAHFHLKYRNKSLAQKMIAPIILKHYFFKRHSVGKPHWYEYVKRIIANI